MAKQIADRPTEFCLSACPYMDLRVQSDIAYADSALYLITNMMSCEHEPICKMWHEREKSENVENSILTSEELREMEGERVWCAEKGRYCLIDIFGEEVLACHEHSELYFGIEGLTFYRREPK